MWARNSSDRSDPDTARPAPHDHPADRPPAASSRPYPQRAPHPTNQASPRLGGQRRSLTGWLVSFVRDIRSERKSTAQTDVIWSAERRLAAYDAFSDSRYVQIA